MRTRNLVSFFVPKSSAPKWGLACYRISTNFCQENERDLCTETLCDHGQGSSEPDHQDPNLQGILDNGPSAGLCRAVASRQVLDGPTDCPTSKATSLGHEGGRRLTWSARGIEEEEPAPLDPHTPPTCDLGLRVTLLWNARNEKGHPSHVHQATEAERGRHLAGTYSCGLLPGHSQA